MGTIFYSDDDEDDRLFFAQAIKEINRNENKQYKLEMLEDAEQLINSLHNPPPVPKVIFLDLNMPGKDGRVTLKEIRADEKLCKLPVVIFSTSFDKEDIDFTYQNGANLYVNKPTHFKDLKMILNKCLEIDWDSHSKPSREEFYLTAS